MSTVRMLMYLIVIGLLLVGVLLMFLQRPQPQVEPPRMVAIAVTDLDTYTVLRPEHLTEKEVSAEEARGAYLGKAGAVGKMTVRPITAGDIINDQVAVACEDFRFVCDMSLEITSFPADFDQMVGGQIRRGHRVNIYGYRGGQGQNIQPEVRLVATNVWVVDVRASSGGEVGRPTPTTESRSTGGLLGAPGAIAGRAEPASIVTVAAEPDIVLDIIRILGAEGFRAWVTLAGSEPILPTPTPTVTRTPTPAPVFGAATPPTPTPTPPPTLTPTPTPIPTLTPTPSPTPLPKVRVDRLETGYYRDPAGQIFTKADKFSLGDKVLIRARVVNEAGQPVGRAAVDLSITKPGLESDARPMTSDTGLAVLEFPLSFDREMEGQFTVRVQDVVLVGYQYVPDVQEHTFRVGVAVVSECSVPLRSQGVYLIGDYTDNFDYEGNNSRAVQGEVSGSVDVCRKTATITARLVITDSIQPERGAESLRGQVELRFRTVPGGPDYLQPGIVEEVNLFGNKLGPPVLPAVKALQAGWGRTEIWVDGELRYDGLDTFFMHTEGPTRDKALQVLVRPPDVEEPQVYDPDNPAHTAAPLSLEGVQGPELHLWLYRSGETLGQAHDSIWLYALFRPLVGLELPITGGER